MTYNPGLSDYIVVAECMADGLPLRKIAARIGIADRTLRTSMPEVFEGYTFKRKKKVFKPRYVKGTNVGKNWDTSKDDDICARFKKGETITVIGESYGVSKQRIQQILKRNEITGRDGGQSMTTFVGAVRKGERKKKSNNERCIKIFGCTKPQYDEIRGNLSYKLSPVGKFKQQRTNSNYRGIKWELSLVEWWRIWQDSGKYEKRGLGDDGYVMARIADTGGYTVDNVEIVTCSQNAKDYYAVHKDDWYEKSRIAKGWTNVHKPVYRDLYGHMADKYGLILTESEMQEMKDICDKINFTYGV